MNGRLYRSRDDRIIAGVAGGLADALDLDPSLVRVLWVILALFSGGAFLIVYIVMALVVPEEPWVPFGASPGATAGTATGSPTGGDTTGSTPADATVGGATTGGTAGDTPTPSAAAAPVPPETWQPGEWQHQREAFRAQRDAWREQRRAERAARRAAGDTGGQRAGLLFGLILVAVGVVFLLPLLFPALDVGRFWPLILVAVGLVLVVAALRPGRPPGP